jgi:hypothetical protein
MRIIGLLLILVACVGMRDWNISFSSILCLLIGLALLFFDVIIYNLKLHSWFKQSKKHEGNDHKSYPPKKRKPYRPRND